MLEAARLRTLLLLLRLLHDELHSVRIVPAKLPAQHPQLPPFQLPRVLHPRRRLLPARLQRFRRSFALRLVFRVAVLGRHSGQVRLQHDQARLAPSFPSRFVQGKFFLPGTVAVGAAGEDSLRHVAGVSPPLQLANEGGPGEGGQDAPHPPALDPEEEGGEERQRLGHGPVPPQHPPVRAAQTLRLFRRLLRKVAA